MSCSAGGLKNLVIATVLRVVHAALVELLPLDSRVRAELEALPEGMIYSIYCGYESPELHLQWKDGKLSRISRPQKATCQLRLKNKELSFQLLTGQMGMAQAYARHAFTMAGEIEDVMKLARLVNLVEAYLFPPFITRHIMTDRPALQVNPLRVYGRIFSGFLINRYK